MKIAVVGTGYVGLVAGACFADSGNDVVCVDRDSAKIERLKRSEIPIYEPGLQEIVERCASEGRIRFTTQLSEGIPGAEAVFLAVGTPPRPDGKPDLRFLESAAREIGLFLSPETVVINKSTVPIGAHARVHEWISEKAKVRFEVASNPEFLKEGSAIEDFMKPDRVVIGTESESVFRKIEALYRPFVRQGNPILWMDPVSAELTKYACNSFLAARISFMNELSRLCDSVGADVEEVRKGMSTDVRIGKHFLYAGVGYGGSCFPKDIQALLSTAKDHGVDLKVAQAAEDANESQKRYLVGKIKKEFGASLKGARIAMLGLAFKPNTDDLREAPALSMIEALLAEGAEIRAYDPVAMPGAEALLKDRIRFAKNALEAAEGCDAVVIATEWNEFRNLSLQKLKGTMRGLRIFDGRNIWDPAFAQGQGFKYFGIGRARRENA